MNGYMNYMTLRRFSLLTTVSLLAIYASPVFAQTATTGDAPAADTGVISVAAQPDRVAKGALNFVNDVGHRGIGFLSNPKMTHAQQQQAFRALLRDAFDLQTIGRFALGQYWRVATPAQRQEYQGLFEQMVITVYSDRFGTYSGQTLKVDSVKMLNDTDAMVTSYVVAKTGGEPIRVDWRVRYGAERYRVVDVVVEGVSMSVTQRSDFAGVINQGGGDVGVLIDHLKNPRKG